MIGYIDTNMKRLLFILLFSFSCNSMAEWVEYLTKANGDIFFFDNTRLHKNGNIVNVWNRVRYKSSIMAASSYESFIQIDCSEYSKTTLQSTFYIDKNWTTPAMATDTKEKAKEAIDANSATEHLANILCND